MSCIFVEQISSPAGAGGRLGARGAPFRCVAGLESRWGSRAPGALRPHRGSGRSGAGSRNSKPGRGEMAADCAFAITKLVCCEHCPESSRNLPHVDKNCMSLVSFVRKKQTKQTLS